MSGCFALHHSSVFSLPEFLWVSRDGKQGCRCELNTVHVALNTRCRRWRDRFGPVRYSVVLLSLNSPVVSGTSDPFNIVAGAQQTLHIDRRYAAEMPAAARAPA
ncbi:hypothetical protein CW304_32900 [Bacillus sp. UFRGS-B20]|nr:hypothetical protein CW304_32900 [Bacillus sp. UFRGS-B20]